MHGWHWLLSAAFCVPDSKSLLIGLVQARSKRGDRRSAGADPAPRGAFDSPHDFCGSVERLVALAEAELAPMIGAPAQDMTGAGQSAGEIETDRDARDRT